MPPAQPDAAEEEAPATAVRWAFYYAPEPDQPLWEAGCTWLQYDPAQPQRQFPRHEGLSQDWMRGPRRYGFHATLKAPMRLQPSASREALVEAASRLARAIRPFQLPPLEVAMHRGFLALRPTLPLTRRHPLRRFADAVVIGLDAFRASPTAEERARHESAGLGPAQQRLLERWGYPHVLGAWRFHMTLSDPLPAQPRLQEALQRQARVHFSTALTAPLVCRSLCLFEQAQPGMPFVLSERLPLGP